MKQPCYSLFKQCKVILRPLLLSRGLASENIGSTTAFSKKILPRKDLVPASGTEIDRIPSNVNPLYIEEDPIAVDHSPSYNLAAYADKSPHLQEFIKLGVNLDKVEKTKGAGEVILRLDFERDAKPYIQFHHCRASDMHLSDDGSMYLLIFTENEEDNIAPHAHSVVMNPNILLLPANRNLDVTQFLCDHGVPPEELGNFITSNPFIFKEELENLQIRINYLEAKLFNSDSISRIITKNPKWLSHSTKNIDYRLGFLQSLFSLVGQEVRQVTTKMPKIVTYSLRHIEVVKFSVVEEMGFTQEESKSLLLSKPKVYTIRREDAVARFNYVHNEMGLSHETILVQPDILTYREARIRERHSFLKSIGRAQYDFKAPGFVSLKALLGSSDTEFCRDVAKTSILIYNKFLKTL